MSAGRGIFAAEKNNVYKTANLCYTISNPAPAGKPPMTFLDKFCMFAMLKQGRRGTCAAVPPRGRGGRCAGSFAPVRPAASAAAWGSYRVFCRRYHGRYVLRLNNKRIFHRLRGGQTGRLVPVPFSEFQNQNRTDETEPPTAKRGRADNGRLSLPCPRMMAGCVRFSAGSAGKIPTYFRRRPISAPALSKELCYLWQKN